MYVRLKSGRQAGQIVEMAYHAATALTSSGQADKPTEAEILAHREALARKARPHAVDPEAPGTLVHEVTHGPGAGRRIVFSAKPGHYDVLVGGKPLNLRPLAMSEAQLLASSDLPPQPANGQGGEGSALPDWREPTAASVVIPQQWDSLAWPQLRMLAGALTTQTVASKQQAQDAIAREIEYRGQDATPPALAIPPQPANGQGGEGSAT